MRLITDDTILVHVEQAVVCSRQRALMNFTMILTVLLIALRRIVNEHVPTI